MTTCFVMGWKGSQWPERFSKTSIAYECFRAGQICKNQKIMNDIIREIIDKVAAKEIAPDVATKRIAGLYPRQSEMFNAAQASPFPKFQKFLDEHAAEQVKKYKDQDERKG